MDNFRPGELFHDEDGNLALTPFDDAVAVWAEGIEGPNKTAWLTAEHAASSYGMPVVVQDGTTQALGPAEAGDVFISADLLEFESCRAMWKRAYEAGFAVGIR